MTDDMTPSEALDSLDGVRTTLTQISRQIDDEDVSKTTSEVAEHIQNLEYQLKSKQADDVDTDEIIEHLETIHQESQAIHDFLHTHEQEISDYGWPRPNPIEKATETEVISEDLIHALEDEDDESDAEAFIKAIDSGEYADYVTKRSSHQLVTPCNHHDFDFVVEPNSDVLDHDTNLLDHIDTEIRNELDLKVSRQRCNNEDGTVLVGVEDDHPLFQ